jgi:hypothetical protein
MHLNWSVAFVGAAALWLPAAGACGQSIRASAEAAAPAVKRLTERAAAKRGRALM